VQYGTIKVCAGGNTIYSCINQTLGRKSYNQVMFVEFGFVMGALLSPSACTLTHYFP
jgi:hypothetical protein